MGFTHNCRRTAFTLVELLVVITIITILASMLLPALGQAREQARRSVCRNNQRQVALAAQLYADDWGYFLGKATNSLEDNAAICRGAGGPSGFGRLYELDYTKEYRIFFCPSAFIKASGTNKPRPPKGYSEIWGDYEFRWYINALDYRGVTPGPYPNVKRIRAEALGQAVLMYDALPCWRVGTTAMGLQNYPHGMQFENIAFSDGSSQAYTDADISVVTAAAASSWFTNERDHFRIYGEFEGSIANARTGQ